jgi:mono/diheme cytochrome c family protein
MRTDPRRIAAMALLIVGGASLAACGGGEKQPAPESAAVVQAGTMSGEQIYQRCVTCHQAGGQGLAGTYPPLDGSEFAAAENPAIPIRILLRGLQGPVTVKGTRFDGIMPAYGTGIEMSDEEVAAVLTYVRSSWNNRASAITASQVAEQRAATASSAPMTVDSLKALMQ